MAVDKRRKKRTDEKPINEELIDELLADYKKPEDVIGEHGLLKRLTKALLQRAMNAELADHLGYQKHDPGGYNSGNSRNGTTSKILKGNFGALELETPRDRNGTFEPKIVAKGQSPETPSPLSVRIDFREPIGAVKGSQAVHSHALDSSNRFPTPSLYDGKRA